MINPWTVKRTTNPGATTGMGRRGFPAPSNSHQNPYFRMPGGSVADGMVTFSQNPFPYQPGVRIYRNVGPVMPFNTVGNYVDFPRLENTIKEPSVFPAGPPLNLEAMRLIRESKSERNFIKDDTGKIMFDCSDMHPSSIMCQFCDGRRGSWATSRPRYDPPTKSDLNFLSYQDNIINSATAINQLIDSNM